MRILIIIVMFFVPSALLAKDYVCVFQEGLEIKLNPYSPSYTLYSGEVLIQETLEVSDIKNKKVSMLKLPESFSMDEKFLETRARQLELEVFMEATYSEGKVIVTLHDLKFNREHSVEHSHFSFSEKDEVLAISETDNRTVNGHSRLESAMYHYRCTEDI